MNMNTENYQIWFYYYTLKRKQKPNAQTASLNHSGALLKIENELGHVGYADICPWPSLFDKSLDEEIKTQGVLYRRAFSLALKDLEARKNKIKLVTEDVILNNILIADYHVLMSGSDYSEHGIDSALTSEKVQQGLYTESIVKIKGDRDIHALAQFLKTYAPCFKKVRLDFNFALNENQFEQFLGLLPQETLKKIQYIEDPFQFDEVLWKKYNNKVKLALDWRSSPNQTWRYLIQKPSREEVDEFVSSTLTSAMEHPVGLVHGLAYAQMYPVNIHGFAVLHLMEDTEFHPYFEQREDGHLIYKSDGYGIGFESVLSKLNWTPFVDLEKTQPNMALVNPRALAQEREHIFEIKKQFTEKIAAKDYFLIPSSGSTKKENESVKVIALSKQALVNSAKRVNSEFILNDAETVWGCLLPQFHVGGLGITLRAKLANSTCVYGEWGCEITDWLKSHKVTHLSLVPTQVYEIVQNKWLAPESLKVVFVGGAALNSELAKEAQNLGWPIIQTFGMTETASMIAVKKDWASDYFTPLKGVKVSSQDQNLIIKSDSNAHYILKLNLITKTLEYEEITEWLRSQDQVEIRDDQFKFLQRESEFVKVKGEGVSLIELRDKLQAVLMRKNMSSLSVLLCDFQDERDGTQLRFIVNEKIKISPDEVESVREAFNNEVRPYERVKHYHRVEQIPVTELGKIKYNVLRSYVLAASEKTESVYVKKI
ncbi:MAG: AMP-binding protein [Pseudobdellovibrio sp.]